MIDPLVVDIYPHDFGGKPDIAKLVAAGYPWCGLILKATEGTYYPHNQPLSVREWFAAHWLPARILPLERYGAKPGAMKMGKLQIGERIVPFFRGAYHYFRADQDPIKQAELFLSEVQAAGGWGPGDLWPMIDVESAENPPDLSAAQLEDGVGLYASKVTQELGRSCMLYGNIYVWERGVKTHMNCGLLTTARYEETLPPAVYQRIGWDLPVPPAIPTAWGWQYTGGTPGKLKGYPTTCPIDPSEPCDITAVIVGGGADPWAALDWTTANLGR